MRNGHTIASVKSKTGASVSFVQNEKGTVLQREVEYADGLGETRTAAISDAIARVLIETNDALTKKAGSKLAS